MSDGNPLSVLVQTGLNFKDKTEKECAALVYECLDEKGHLDKLRWYIAGCRYEGGYTEESDYYYGIEGTSDWNRYELEDEIHDTFYWNKIKEGNGTEIRKLMTFLKEVENQREW